MEQLEGSNGLAIKTPDADGKTGQLEESNAPAVEISGADGKMEQSEGSNRSAVETPVADGKTEQLGDSNGSAVENLTADDKVGTIDETRAAQIELFIQFMLPNVIGSKEIKEEWARDQRISLANQTNRPPYRGDTRRRIKLTAQSRWERVFSNTHIEMHRALIDIDLGKFSLVFKKYNEQVERLIPQIKSHQVSKLVYLEAIEIMEVLVNILSEAAEFEQYFHLHGEMRRFFRCDEENKGLKSAFDLKDRKLYEGEIFWLKKNSQIEPTDKMWEEWSKYYTGWYRNSKEHISQMRRNAYKKFDEDAAKIFYKSDFDGRFTRECIDEQKFVEYMTELPKSLTADVEDFLTFHKVDVSPGTWEKWVSNLSYMIILLEAYLSGALEPWGAANFTKKKMGTDENRPDHRKRSEEVVGLFERYSLRLQGAIENSRDRGKRSAEAADSSYEATDVEKTHKKPKVDQGGGQRICTK